MSNVGFIGLGIMGTPMAGHLIKGGHKLWLHDIKPAPKELVEKTRSFAPRARKSLSRPTSSSQWPAVRSWHCAGQDRGPHELDLSHRNQACERWKSWATTKSGPRRRRKCPLIDASPARAAHGRGE